MELRPLGDTGLRVSALGFGCGAIGGLMVRSERAEQVRALGRALDAGITYFDTAQSYGDGRSEENLGAALAELGAQDRVVVGTKVNVLQLPQTGDLTAALCESVAGSLRRLRREFVHVLHLHGGVAPPDAGRRNSYPPEAGTGAIADALAEAQRRGLARHVGFTGLGDPASVRQMVASGRFRSVQCYFNPLNPSAGYAGASGGADDFGGVIDEAAAGGVGVLAIRVLAAGAVAGPERAPHAGDPGSTLVPGNAFAADLERAARLRELVEEVGTESPVELALRFALAKEGVSSVLVGFSDEAQLEQALAWTARGPLSAPAVDRIVALARRG